MVDNEQNLLTQFGRQRPFCMPDGYLEQLQQTVMQRVANEPTEHRPTLWVRLRKPLTVAASVALLAGVALGLLTKNGQTGGAAASGQQKIEVAEANAQLAKQLPVVATQQQATLAPTAIIDETVKKVRLAVSESQAKETTKETVKEQPEAPVASESELDIDAAADLMMLDAEDLIAMMADEL